MIRPVIVAAVGVAVMSVAPAAHAEGGNEGQYVSDVQASGIHANAQDIVTDGYRVCHMLNDGMPPTAVAGTLYGNSQSANGSEGISLDQANAIVKAAVQDLC
jgi:hypothetical protein